MGSIKVKVDTKKIEKKINNLINNRKNELLNNSNIQLGDKMPVLNDVQREFLKIILQHEKDEYIYQGVDSNFPVYIEEQKDNLFSYLKNAGYIANFESWITGGWRCVLTPLGINYFEKEDDYKEMNKQVEFTLNANGSCVNFGNIYDSTFNIDNSYNNLEKMINDNGKEDIEELKEILEEVKDYIENIYNNKCIGKNKSLFTKIGNHFEKHQWFYQSIIELIGNAVLNVMQGQ